MSEIPAPTIHPRAKASMKPTQRDIVYSICTIVTGVGIGWFLGLGSEGLVGTVLMPVLTLITGAAGILAGVGITTERSDGVSRADPVLITILVIGLVGGSILSAYARNNLWPRPDAAFIQRETGIPWKEVNRRVFDKLYSPPSATGSLPVVASNSGAGATEKVDCTSLKAHPETMLQELRKLPNPQIKQLLSDPNPSPSAIKEALKIACTSIQ